MCAQINGTNVFQDDEVFGRVKQSLPEAAQTDRRLLRTEGASVGRVVRGEAEILEEANEEEDDTEEVREAMIARAQHEDFEVRHDTRQKDICKFILVCFLDLFSFICNCGIDFISLFVLFLSLCTCVPHSAA
jgi:hypothetical protein